MSRRAASVSTDAVAAETADALLRDGASAIAAVIGGFFAAAGQRPGVLFGPVTALIAAVGTGTRALDGRLRQPGLGAKRPRGFVEGDAVPSAAYVAAPAGIAALLVALAYDEQHRVAPVLAPGIRLAEKAGSASRAELLRKIGSMGARALTDGTVARPIIAVGSPAEGGLLTTRDLESAHAVDQAAAVETRDGQSLVTAPWAADEVAASEPSQRQHAVVAMDARGAAATVTYAEVLDGVEVPELEVIMALAAVPVRRGVPRTSPGSPLPAAAPAAIWLAGGTPVEARADSEARPPPDMRYGLVRDPETRRVQPIRSARR